MTGINFNKKQALTNDPQYFETLLWNSFWQLNAKGSMRNFRINESWGRKCGGSWENTPPIWNEHLRIFLRLPDVKSNTKRISTFSIPPRKINGFHFIKFLNWTLHLEYSNAIQIDLIDEIYPKTVCGLHIQHQSNEIKLHTNQWF